MIELLHINEDPLPIDFHSLISEIFSLSQEFNQDTEDITIIENIQIDKDCYYLGYTRNKIPDGLGVFVFNDFKCHIG
jgi:hypothetical protein